MAEYIPSPREWVRDQVELYERSGGTEGTTLRDTGLPVIIVTHTGNKTGAIRKTPLMRVTDGANYILVGSMGGAPTHPVWVYNLRANPRAHIELGRKSFDVTARELPPAERADVVPKLTAEVSAFAEYQARTSRVIPIFELVPDER